MAREGLWEWQRFESDAQDHISVDTAEGSAGGSVPGAGGLVVSVRENMMVLTLHIRHDGSHQYLARVFDGKVQVGESTLHARIDDAIAAYGAQGAQSFPGTTGFAIWYGGWSIGMKPLAQMVDEAALLANRLVVLSAVVR